MAERIRNAWNDLRGSLWFLPALMSLGGFLLAYAAIAADAGLRADDLPWWIFAGEASDARELLSALLSSMITMTTLVVSITVVVLTLAAAQFGSRIVRSFMTDLTTKLVMGVFAMTIAYLLLALRTVAENMEFAEVPHLAVTVGTGLALASLFVLLYFVHHLARSVVSNHVIAQVALELHRTIRLLEAERPPTAESEAGAATLAARLTGPADIALDRRGYVQAVAFSELAEAARRQGAALRLDFRPGQFLTPGVAVARAEPRERTAELAKALRSAVVTGSERTPTQDVEHSIRHLVEIALRALSPGINDPFTAEAVIDTLGVALRTLFAQGPRHGVHFDRAGAPRILAPVSDEAGLVGVAFDQIRQAAEGRPDVLMHLVDMLRSLARTSLTGEQRALLRRQLDSVLLAARRSVPDPLDLAEIERRGADARARLGDHVDEEEAGLQAQPAFDAAGSAQRQDRRRN